jgi:fatty-acyl-CoA synthase
METLVDWLDRIVDADPEREVIAYAPQDEVEVRLTRRQLRESSRVAAKKLLSVGVNKGTRVGLLCSNRLEWLPIAFGVFRLGAILVPFSTLWKEREIAYGLSHGDVSSLVTLPGFLRHDYLSRLHAVVPELSSSKPGQLRSASAPFLRRVILLEGETPGAEQWKDLSTDVDDAFLDALEKTVSPFDRATIFFTSGTTAQAKAVVHNQGSITTSASAISERLGIGADDAWWGHMPLFWSGGLILGALSALAGGGRVVLQETVEPGAALRLLERERCTIMAGWHQAGPLMDHADFGTRALFLRKGSYHPLTEKFMGPDHQAVGMYGMSETATCVTCASWDESREIRVTTAGRPVPGASIRIIDPETEKVLPTGETGEICVKGPSLMEGYYKVPRENVFDREGFFRTGDRGFIDETGYLHFLGRLKDVIKTAGVNVAASEVEEMLTRHPSVKAAYVVGVSHPTRGENLAAFVVLEPGATLDSHSLQSFCKERLASYKVPRHFFRIDEGEIPRTGTGKVEKTALRRLAESRASGT